MSEERRVAKNMSMAWSSLPFSKNSTPFCMFCRNSLSCWENISPNFVSASFLIGFGFTGGGWVVVKFGRKLKDNDLKIFEFFFERSERCFPCTSWIVALNNFLIFFLKVEIWKNRFGYFRSDKFEILNEFESLIIS